jgi:5-methylcytosine-specific restriction endonuclease McrA
MAITKAVRDQLLVEARHRCTICSEKCFEIHHIIERAEGGSDELENLIVLCPNCHQHRYHRSGEFTREQLRLYKQKLKEQNEIERRVLQNLEEIRQNLATVPPEESERKLTDRCISSLSFPR